jgi:pimeloyl-ACP methyl ester carboxylesterase
MHVERYGHGGAPVVLLHGFGTSSFLWRNIGPTLALAKLTAYAVDLFGYGESDRPIDADFGLAAQSDYLERALTALRVARAAIVGVDIGGGIALRLAATRPERVARLVLINPTMYEKLPGNDVRELQRNTARFALRVSRGMFGVSSLLAPVLEGSVASTDHMPPLLIGRYIAPFVGNDGVTHLLALARSIRAQDLEDVDLAEVRASALIIWGEEDKWLDPQIPDRLAADLPNARLHRMPGIARLVPEESPDELANLIAEFVNSDAPPRGPAVAAEDADNSA